ncbi:MAG: class I adenylate-forming enzyme family protein [Acidimicrobiia bacterium]
MALLVGDVIRRAARATPARLAATLGEEHLRFAELDSRSDQVAGALAAMGVGHGDRVAWWGDTSLVVMPIFAGLAKLGAVFAPVNGRLSAAEAAEVAGYARPRLVVVDDDRPALGERCVTHSELFGAADRLDAALVEAKGLGERDPHVIFFTSGSTGRPKGVVLSHRVTCLRSFPALAADVGDAGAVCMFPLFHMAGWSMAMNAWQARAPLHLVTTADASTLLGTVERRRASRLYLIPAVWARILEQGVSGHDLSSLREADTGTSATPPELVAAVRDALPHTVTRIFYGSTEAGPGAVLAHHDLARKPGSVGLPQPGVDVRIADDGEVCLRSELLMDGYFEQPDETVAALRDGWYHTGDLGVLDDEGYLSIVGRARDVIRTGGETVAPSEVEDALADHPGVAEVAVVGLPDPEWGELVCAVVVLTTEAATGTVDVEALRSHCDGRLARFKQPRRVAVVDALPRTPATGQVQRTLLVERLSGD